MASTIQSSRTARVRDVGLFRHPELDAHDWDQFLQQTDDVSKACSAH